MATTLGFDRDPERLRWHVDPVRSQAQDLLSGLLYQRIRLIVDGNTVLDDQASILLFAFYPPHLLANLPRTRSAWFRVGEGSVELEFDLRGDQVIVRERLFNKVAETSYRELVDAWNRFAVAAKDYLRQELPELTRHPVIGLWFEHYPGPQ